jgi:uncharacterized membrane protein HdeD (DUF308 family)
MESQAMTQVMKRKESAGRRLLFAIGVVTLTFGTALTGSPKTSIAGVAILVFCALF